MTDRLIFLHEKIEVLKAENRVLRELVDGAMDIVALSAETPYQKVWAKEWVAKARGALE
jgi:hypothetical protein